MKSLYPSSASELIYFQLRNHNSRKRCKLLLSVKWELSHTGFYLAHHCSLVPRHLSNTVATAAEEMPSGKTSVRSCQLFGLQIATVIRNIAEQRSNQLRNRQQAWHVAPVSLQPPLGPGEKSGSVKASPLTPTREESWKNWTTTWGVLWSLPCQIRGMWIQAHKKSKDAVGSNLQDDKRRQIHN